MAELSSPDVVAEAFLHAMSDPEPKLRYMVASREFGARWAINSLMQRIVEIIGVDRKTVESMAGRLGGYDVSLDQPVGSEADSAPRSAFIPANDPDPETSLAAEQESANDTRDLYAAISELPEREQEIIQRRHLNDEKETLQEVGERLGISRERVRQLEVRAFRRMRQALESRRRAA